MGAYSILPVHLDDRLGACPPVNEDSRNSECRKAQAFGVVGWREMRNLTPFPKQVKRDITARSRLRGGATAIRCWHRAAKTVIVTRNDSADDGIKTRYTRPRELIGSRRLRGLSTFNALLPSQAVSNTSGDVARRSGYAGQSNKGSRQQASVRL